MNRFALTTALLAALAAAPAVANPQLARSLGIEPGTFTTAQLAAVKASIDNADDNRAAKALIERFSMGDVSTMSVGTSAGATQLAHSFGVEPGSFTTAQLAAVKASIDNDDDNRAAKALIERFSMSDVSTMSTGVSAGAAQLARNIGVAPGAFSNAELAALKSSFDSENPTN